MLTLALLPEQTGLGAVKVKLLSLPKVRGVIVTLTELDVSIRQGEEV